MNTNEKAGNVKLMLDAELRDAIDAARRNHRSTRTGYVRAVLLTALRREGHLVGINEGSR